MQEAVVHKLSLVDFDKLAISFELDLIEYHKILEEALIEITEKAKKGMTEEEIMKEIEYLFEGEPK